MSVWINKASKFKKVIVLSYHVLRDCMDEKPSARDKCYRIVVSELGKLNRVIS